MCDILTSLRFESMTADYHDDPPNQFKILALRFLTIGNMGKRLQFLEIINLIWDWKPPRMCNFPKAKLETVELCISWIAYHIKRGK